MTEPELHSLIRKTNKKADIKVKHDNTLSQKINYVTKPEKVEVKYVTISPRKLQKYEVQKKEMVREKEL